MNNNYIEYESSGDGNIKLSVKEYLDKIKPYLRDIIINLQKSDTWKIQLTIAINFISSKDVDEERVMYSKSDNIEFMLYDNGNEVVNKLFESSGRNCTFDSVQLMYYKCHNVNFKRDGSYIDTPDLIKKKKTTINRKNTDDKCFQYTVTVALNYAKLSGIQKEFQILKHL